MRNYALDRQVHEEIFGKRPRRGGMEYIPAYSGENGPMMLVVEAMADSTFNVLLKVDQARHTNKATAMFWLTGDPTPARVDAISMPEAVCKAALDALRGAREAIEPAPQ